MVRIGSRRCFFGCSSASEEFDDNLKGKLSGLRGVKNIADDILAYGKTREEHDANLKALLLRPLEAQTLTPHYLTHYP